MWTWRNNALKARHCLLRNRRCFCADSGKNGESSGTSSSVASPSPDEFEKLKNWSLVSQLNEAIKAGKNDAAMELLPTLRKYDMITTASCNEFLQQCSVAANIKVARCIMEFMQENGVERNERSHAFLLGAVSRSGRLDEAMELLETLVNERVEDLICLFNAVLNGCASAGSSFHADKCLKLMESKGVEKNHQTYIELIRLAGKTESLGVAKDLWIELKSRYAPVFNSYRTYIIALCRGKDLAEALVVLQEMLDDLAKVLKASESVPSGVTEVFNAIISAANKAGQYELAEMMFTEMNRMEIPVTVVTYDALIRAVVKGRGVDYGLKLVHKMQAAGLEPDSAIYGALVEGYCRSSQLDKAENLLEQMLKAKASQRPTSHAFNFILQACSLTNEQHRALRIFRKMKDECITPDICTYTALFCIFGSVTFPYTGGDQASNEDLNNRLRAIESDMVNSKIQHSRQSFTALIRGLGAEGMIGPAMKRLIVAESFFSDDGTCFLDAFAYNTAIYACIMFNQFSEAKDLFTRMSSKGVKPNLHTYNIMIFGCLQSKNVSFAHELLDALKRDDIVPDSVTYNSLIKVLCSSNELEAALEVIQTMDRAGVEADVYSFNTIIAASALRGRIDMIEFLVEDMNDRKIPPNSYTILKIMLTYIHLKRLDDAVGAVRDLSARMLEGGEDSKNSMQNAVQVLMQDSTELVEKMTESLVKTIESSSDSTAEALYSLSLAGLAGCVDGEEAQEAQESGVDCNTKQTEEKSKAQTISHTDS